MKKLGLLFLLSGILISCNIRDSKNKLSAPDSSGSKFTDTTSVQMIDSVYNFGNAMEGAKVEHDFRFRNTGSKPLIISSARASCGCTVPQKPEEPVKPGETGVIKVVFNTASHPGPAHKTVTVVSNAIPGMPELLLTGMVDAKKQ